MKNAAAAPQQEPLIALVNFDEANTALIITCDLHVNKLVFFKNGGELANNWTKQRLNIVMVIVQGEVLSPLGIALLKNLVKKGFPSVPFLLVSHHLNNDTRKLSLSVGITDIFLQPIKKKNLEIRINFLVDNRSRLRTVRKDDGSQIYRTPVVKRIFDVFFAGIGLLLLSPFLLVVYVLIRLESKGPAFYYSLRVGTGYRIFKFYKYRSMYVNADKRLKDLKHLNQYTVETTEVSVNKDGISLCNECKRVGTTCQFPIYADKVRWCEKEYMSSQRTASGAAFFKLKDDPRITKVGKFIRNTSIDELPQLWNVIIGDMSIVGNRPLPLYEAEKLTTDKYALRFTAPAGITGLWQVEKRGKGEMSEEERLLLDNTYAENHSFMNDIKLICRTIPALFQKENV